MNIDAIKDELKNKMEASIDRIHKETTATNSNSGANYKNFKDDLYKTVFDLIEKNKLEFRNHEQSKNFLEELKPTCEYLLTKYFLG